MTGYMLNTEGTIARISDGAVIPLDDGNLDYQAYALWLAAGNQVAVKAPPLPSEADVTREYERRLFARLGARDLAHAAFIRADNDVEMRGLEAKPNRTAEETAWLLELHNIDAAVALLIERYNAMPSPPPLDFASDARWEASA